MKKLYGILVVLLVLAIVLIGCSSPATTSPAPATSAKPAPASSTSAVPPPASSTSAAPPPAASSPSAGSPAASSPAASSPAASAKPSASPTASGPPPKLGGTLNVIIDNIAGSPFRPGFGINLVIDIPLGDLGIKITSIMEFDAFVKSESD